MWTKLKSWFSKKPTGPIGWTKKIHAIRGEMTPGVLLVDIATYDEKDELVPAESTQLELPITPKLRATCNRILCGLETEDDRKVLETYVQSKL